MNSKPEFMNLPETIWTKFYYNAFLSYKDTSIEWIVLVYYFNTFTILQSKPANSMHFAELSIGQYSAI